MERLIHSRGLLGIITNAISHMFDYFNIKICTAIGVVLYSFFFGDLPYVVTGSVIALVFIDMITGMFASKRSGIIISSRRALATAGKLAVYGLLISAGHLTEVVIGFNARIDESIMVILAVTELISILENGATLGYSIPQKLLNRLKELRGDDKTNTYAI